MSLKVWQAKVWMEAQMCCRPARKAREAIRHCHRLSEETDRHPTTWVDSWAVVWSVVRSDSVWRKATVGRWGGQWGWGWWEGWWGWE
jgi:hypothetical protein